MKDFHELSLDEKIAVVRQVVSGAEKQLWREVEAIVARFGFKEGATPKDLIKRFGKDSPALEGYFRKLKKLEAQRKRLRILNSGKRMEDLRARRLDLKRRKQRKGPRK